MSFINGAKLETLIASGLNVSIVQDARPPQTVFKSFIFPSINTPNKDINGFILTFL